jgi:multiple sugar transport system substrate-binding protein
LIWNRYKDLLCINFNRVLFWNVQILKLPRRKTMKGRIVFSAGIMAIAMISPFTPAHAVDAVPVTHISLATWGSSPSETAALTDSIATFESRYPAIKVDLIVDTDHSAQMAAKFASHTPPDVFYLDAGVAQDWASQGVLLDLNPLIASTNFNLAPFNSSYLKPFQSGGATYGLPKDANPLVLEGNTALMARAKISKLPTTIKELDAQSKKLMAKKITPVCVDADINRLGAFMYAFGGGIGSGTKSLLGSAGTKAAMAWVMGNYRSGEFRTPAQLSAGWAGEAFGKGKCAYTMEGAWLDPFLHDSFPAVYSHLIKGPLPMAKKAGSLAFTAAYAIGKESANPTQAWTFISYMTGARGMTIWTSYGVALPSRSDVAIPLGYEVNGAVAKLKTTVTTPAFVGWSKVIDAFNNEAKKQIQDKNFNVAKAVSSVLSKASAAWPAG